MKIAILGWGSLIWDERPEFDKWHGDWLPDGPSLELEFSRVSKSRLRALTLVIDERHGQICTVEYALSKRDNLDDTICDLRGREGTILKHIGYYLTDDTRSGEPATSDAIKIWAKEKKLDGVVWTGLPSNFQMETRQKEFSIPNAINHLKSLPAEGKAKAAEYVWRAPAVIDTPLRRALETEPWFSPPKDS